VVVGYFDGFPSDVGTENMVDCYGFSFIILCLFSMENQQSLAAEHSTDTKHKKQKQ
jgi:hypothetical protein